MLIELLPEGPRAEDVDGLADLLIDAVVNGANVGFLEALTRSEAQAWWLSVLAEPGSRTWVARDDQRRIVGTVRLIPAGMPNGAHRAAVSKLLVHSEFRGRGCAAQLMAELEPGARAIGRSLLVLDTETGSPAELIYERWGWLRVGVIDNFAASPGGQLAGTTIFSKQL